MCTCVAFMYILKVYLSVYVYTYIYVYTVINIYICIYMHACIQYCIFSFVADRNAWSISSSNQNTEFQPGSLNLMLRTIKSPDYSDYSNFSGM